MTIADPLTAPQYLAWQAALREAQGKLESGSTTQADVDAAILPAILACAEKWELAGFPATPTAETFPFTPRQSREALIAWLVKEIAALSDEADDVPNG